MENQKCQFCGDKEGHISITDDETQQELLICEECDELLYFKTPQVIQREKGYTEFTLQELNKKIDELIDNEIEERKMIKEGIEI